MKPAIITFVVSLLLILVVSQAYANEPQVTCWIIPGTGISCLPDSQLRQPIPATGRAQDRANPASAPIPSQHDEVFQL